MKKDISFELKKLKKSQRIIEDENYKYYLQKKKEEEDQEYWDYCEENGINLK